VAAEPGTSIKMVIWVGDGLFRRSPSVPAQCGFPYLNLNRVPILLASGCEFRDGMKHSIGIDTKNNALRRAN